MNEEELCLKFLSNPGINPKTGKRLIKGKGPYQQYMELCRKHRFVIGDEQIGVLYNVDKLPSITIPIQDDHECRITYKNKVIFSSNPSKPIIKKYPKLDRSNVAVIDLFLNFPDDIVIEIFKYVTVNNCIAMSLSNKKFYQLIRSDHLWQHKYLSKFGEEYIVKDKSYYDLYRLATFLSKGNYRYTLPELFAKKEYKEENIERTTLPVELFHLTHLQHLTYSANFVKEIPITISNLNKLVELDLSANKISVIPEEIGKLIYLKALNLACNEIKELPVAVCGLYNLVALLLNRNRITSIPSEINRLVNLHLLELDRGVIIPQIKIGHATIRFL